VQGASCVVHVSVFSDFKNLFSQKCQKKAKMIFKNCPRCGTRPKIACISFPTDNFMEKEEGKIVYE